MGQVRILGDPFGEDAAASLMRSFLRVLLGSGVRCSLALAVATRPPQPGQRAVASSDGVRDVLVATSLPPAEVELLLRAAGASVASTAPVVVFAPAERRADAVHAAGLAWPRATAVIGVREGVTAQELLERVRAEVRWAGVECPQHALDERELAPWLQLPPLGNGSANGATNGPIVAVGDGTYASGLDLAIAAWRRDFARAGRGLRLVVDGSATATSALRELLGDDAARAEIVTAPFRPEHVLDAAAVLMPFRRFTSPRLLVQALASARPVIVSRFGASAPLLAGPGICLPLGGHVVDTAVEALHVEPPYFEPHAAAIAAALQRAAGDAGAAAAVGQRARSWVIAELLRDAPAAPPPAVHRAAPRRPVLVLEAPLFAPSAAAEVAIATAQALVRRDRVDVRLVAAAPVHGGLDALRARAPELVARLCRDPGTADAWLSSGPRVRASRPPARVWAMRVDHEHGALPLDALPHATQEADVVLVPSEHVLRAVTAAGRAEAAVLVVPHGVDADLHEGVAADPRIVAWKQQRAAVLFCGAPIWRKGIDVFLRAVLGAHRAGANVCAVVKLAAHAPHDGGDQRALLERFQQTAGTPPLLVVDGTLSRAELAAVYTACDLMLHPYRAEGFCLPVLEARACGLPVLATGSGACAATMTGPGVVAIPAVRREIDLQEPHASAPWVLEPSAAETERLLAGMLEALPAHQRAARAFAPSMRASFAWDVAAQALEDIATDAMRQRREPVVALARTNAPSAVPAPRVPVRG